MNFRMAVLLLATLPSMGIYRGCDNDSTEISHANQQEAYNLKTSRAITLQGGWKDTLLVGDFLESGHGQGMRWMLVDIMGIPEHHLSFTLPNWGNLPGLGNGGLNDLASGEYESLRKSSRVVHLPLFRPLADSQDVRNVRDNTILFVIAVGNTYIYDADGKTDNNWDAWNPEHAGWQPDIFYPADLSYSKTVQDNIPRLVDSGKVIFATSARVVDGEVMPERRVMRCGVMLKDACFTILPVQYTSDASARLAAMAFYLAQFWDTPEEIVSVLKQCAVDVGEPGVDVEYGHGIATLLCAPVVEKEMDIILSYSSAPAAKNLRNVLRALQGEPEFERFVRAVFLN